MKIKIKKDLLQEGLNKVSKAISTKNLIPILSGIKFDLTNEGLTLTASDNDITIQNYIPLNKDNMTIENEGSIIIQGKYILDIVRKLPDEYINIEVIDGLKIRIYAENSEFNLNGINKKEYPNIVLENSKNFVKIKTKLFRSLINQTVFATSNDESRAVFTGLNFIISDNILECSATDSYRLAKKQAKLNESSPEIYNVIVPGKNIVEFSKIISDSIDEIEIHIFNNKILFKHGNILFQTRLINGKYPDINNSIPTASNLKFTADLNSLYDVIDRASILTSDKEKNIVTLETQDNVLIVKSSSAEIGRVEEKMIITKDSDKEIVISFSAKYMMEALKSFEGSTVELCFTEEIKPIVIRDISDPDLIQIVSPIRTY